MSAYALAFRILIIFIKNDDFQVEEIQSDIDKIQAKVEDVKLKHSTILSSAQTDDSKILKY